ncbi:hypothetical protein AWENTII_001649 [Aspergillus wentii]|nr:hypothetical protein MW887_010293 [Aspergillus wentii]
MALVFYISTAIIAYAIALVVYRLRFSKLAKFPGPRLAAATLWYEFYYDVICRGKYIFKIEEMHKTYGPIVRISPFELHVNDPDFYDALYSHTAPRNKYDWFASQFGYMDTAFSTVDHDVHRPRRKAISPYFSKSKVREAEPIIEKLVNRLCDRLTDFQNTNTPVDIAAALSCFLADAISEYTIGKPLHLLDDPSFVPHWRKSVGQMAETAGVAKHIPAIHLIRTILPVSWLSALIPGMALINDYSTQCRKEIDTIIENSESGHKSLAERNTLFAELVNSDLPPQEKSAERLQHEMEIILSAATEAPTIVLTTITFYLLNDPEKLSKLKRELAEAERSQGHPLTVSDLEQLP